MRLMRSSSRPSRSSIAGSPRSLISTGRAQSWKRAQHFSLHVACGFDQLVESPIDVRAQVCEVLLAGRVVRIVGHRILRVASEVLFYILARASPRLQALAIGLIRARLVPCGGGSCGSFGGCDI